MMLVRALAWLGRQGTRAIAALVFIAIALPPLDRLLKPFVTEAIFALLVLAFLRVEPAALRGHLRRPGLVLAATAWTMLVLPVALGTLGLALGLDQRAPGLFLAIMLQALAPPLMVAPSFAAAMGLDAALVLAVLLASCAITPVTAPVFAALFLGDALRLSPVTLGTKLFAIIAGAAVLAAIVRRLAGAEAIRRRKPEIDGVNILLAYVFVGAVMENVAASVLAMPATLLGLIALAVALCFGLLGLSALVLARAGADRAFALGFAASQRNMGLMLAATGGALPDTVWLWFAVSQFPIYLAPQVLKPLAKRLTARTARA
jgi:BASS family bile acid:Na+ symporter